MTIENKETIESNKVQIQALKQNFGLTEQRFEEMLSKMQDGDEALFEQVFLVQFEESLRFLMHNYRISRSLAYDVTMDALLKFRKRLIAGKINYGNMRYLFTRMAGQFLSEDGKKRTEMLSGIELSDEKEEIDEAVLDALDLAWLQLCKDCSNVLQQFYYQKIALKTIALHYQKTEAALRKKKQRCLDKLRTAFLKYYVQK